MIARHALLALIPTAVVGLALGRLAGPQEPAAEPGATAVPFRLTASNHMVVETKLNGKGPYRLIFDLGAPVMLLSNRAAEESGVIAKGAPRSILFNTRGEERIKTLAVGDLEAKDVPALVLDHPVVRLLGEATGQRLDGIVGYTFWARYRMTIDYQAKRMTFTPVDFEVRNLMQDLPERMMRRAPAKTVVLSPPGLWGLAVGEPEGGADSPGVPVTAVRPGSPAAAAGLKVGDLLVSLDGRWTASIPDTYAAAAGVAPGQEARVVVRRDGQEQELTVRPRDGI